MKVYPETKNYKKHDLCVISIENQFLVSFSLDPALYYATPRHNPRSDFLKMVLKWAQGLKEKSHEVSARKNNNRLRYNKKCRGGRIRPPPGSFRVNGKVEIFRLHCSFDFVLYRLAIGQGRFKEETLQDINLIAGKLLTLIDRCVYAIRFNALSLI